MVLKDAPDLPEGVRVYVIVPEIEGTAFDPDPIQIAIDVRRGLAEFKAGKVMEIQGAEQLLELISELSEPA